MSNEPTIIATIPAPKNTWDRFNEILPLVQEGLGRNLDKQERSDLLFLVGEHPTLSVSAICIKYAQQYSGTARKARRIGSFLKRTLHEGASALADKTE